MKKSIFFILACCLFLSCNKDKDSVPLPTGIEYFPMDIGSYRIYDVHLIQFSNDTIDTMFQIKEVIQDSFYYQNKVVYELYRFYRSDDSKPWPRQPDSVWTFTTDFNQITIQEASTNFVRLVFPLSTNKSWDGNTRNTYGRDDYTVTNFDKPFGTNMIAFPQTSTIIEEQSKNLVFKDYRSRVYAKNVGMIFKHYEYIAYKTEGAFIGLDKVDYGNLREETLIGYGKP